VLFSVRDGQTYTSGAISRTRPNCKHNINPKTNPNPNLKHNP